MAPESSEGGRFEPMKYVIISKDGMELAILFPDQVQHAEAVDCLKVKPVAAGFLRDGDVDEGVCYGGSVSLGLASRGAVDAEVIQFSMGLMEQQVSGGVGTEEQN